MSSQLKIIFAGHRRCFYRNEALVFQFDLMNFIPCDIQNCRLSLDLGGILKQEQKIEKLGIFGQGYRFEFSSGKLSSGYYNLFVSLESEGKILAKADFQVGIAPPLRERGVELWHWPATVHYNALEADWECAKKEIDKLAETGYTIAQFRGGWGLHDPVAAIRLIEYAMMRGIALGILIANGGGGVFKMNSDLPPDAELVDATGCRSGLADAYHPAVQEQNRILMERLMRLFRHFPSCNTVFMNSEVEDRLKIAFNPETKTLHEKNLGFPLSEVKRIDCIFSGALADADFTKPGVIADNDRNYSFARYYFKDGDGFTLMNRTMSGVVKRYRPDMLTITDPMRNCSLYGRFDGTDVVSTWTYTNPDPKAMLFIETLRREAAPDNQPFIHTITLWNYAGSLMPSGKDRFCREHTLRMEADRFSETAWLNFTRAPMAIGTYFGSPIELALEGGDPFIYSPETEKAIADFAHNVLRPFGAMMSRTRQSRRRIAVLDAFASRVYGISPRPYNHYPNYSFYNFYIILAMAHLEADVIFEETLNNESLDQYEMLVLPACDTLPESVYRKIVAFAERGGMVVADQYLRADIPNTIRFDFDFEYRKRVNANANTRNRDFTIKDDTNFRKTWEETSVEGVPADRDQQILEGYAECLRNTLDGLFQRDFDCSSPRVLLNCREAAGIKYLTAVNDHRTWGNRVAKWKSMLEKGLPEPAVFTIADPGFEPVVYDLLAHCRVPVTAKTDGCYQFESVIPAAGGALYAIYPEPIGDLQISGSAPGTIKINTGTTLGLQPLQLEISGVPDYSGYYVAENGVLNVEVPRAENDPPGLWQVVVRDLTTGNQKSCN